MNRAEMLRQVDGFESGHVSYVHGSYVRLIRSMNKNGHIPIFEVADFLQKRAIESRREMYSGFGAIERLADEFALFANTVANVKQEKPKK